jgi:hypothetical protein
MCEKVYVNNWMQVTMKDRPFANLYGLLKALFGSLCVKKIKREYLGLAFLALLVQAAIRSGC